MRGTVGIRAKPVRDGLGAWHYGAVFVRRGWRWAVLAAALLASLGSVTACQSAFAGLRLTIATGSSDGVYYQLGSQLATAWASSLGITRPTVLETAGSLENIQRLRAGTADIAFGSADAITGANAGPRKLRALARIYDDYIQVLVQADSKIESLAQLAGHTVAIGSVNSGVQVVADNLLRAAGLHEKSSP